MVPIGRRSPPHNGKVNDALLGALIGGGATCLATYITIRHEGRMSRQAILQSRFADAYVTLQIYISSWADHAQWNLNIIRMAGEKEPTLPQVSDVEGARVSLFASNEVVAAMKGFYLAMARYRLAVGTLEDVRKRQALTGPAIPDLKPAVDGLTTAAKALVASAEDVHQKLRRDLTGSRSHAWEMPMHSMGRGRP